MSTPAEHTIAYFITSHGYGHACRAAAVMEAVLRLHPETRFELFTTSPRELFTTSIGNEYGYHLVNGDVGMVQLSPLEEDLSATCDQLDSLLPYHRSLIDHLATEVVRLNCGLVICDIAPLGIEVARTAGLPSILVENFTWNWIYESYAEQEHRFMPHIKYLCEIFQQADHHIQTPPLCNPLAHARYVAPISRRVRSSPGRIKKELGIPEEEKMVLLSMGGVPDRHAFLSNLRVNLNWHLVVVGIQAQRSPRHNVHLLPTHSKFFHPDLVASADALVGKAGYSTVAEAYHCGVPFGYIKRPHSPESAVLEAYIERHLPSKAIASTSYASGEWIDAVPELLRLPRGMQQKVNGADQVATHVVHLLA